MAIRVLMIVAAALVVAAPSAAQQRYVSPEGWSLTPPPQGWVMAASRDGRAVAFLGPAASVQSGRFRPSLVVSSAPVSRDTPDEQVILAVPAALSRAVPGSVLLGQQRALARDRQLLLLSYYYAAPPAGTNVPGLYIIVGVAPRAQVAGRVFTLLATLVASPGSQQQAVQLRDVMLSFAVR